MPAPLSGIVPPILTPFHPDGTVDEVSLTRLTEHLISAGVAGVFALGSTGEVAYLTDAQRSQVVRTVVRAANGRVPIIAGAIDLTSARVAEVARRAVDDGADTVVATAPVYAINDVAEIADHFRTIAAAISVPLYAYDVPVRVHSKLPGALLVQLGVEGVLAGVKDSSGDDVAFRRLIAMNQAAGHVLQVFTGHEVVVDAMGLIGADGAVPGLANVDAAGYVRLWQAVRSGDWASAVDEQLRLNELFEIVFCATGRSGDAAGVGSFKAAAAALGLIDTAVMAEPVKALEGAALERVSAVLEAWGRNRT